PDRAHSAPLDVALSGGMGALAAWLALLGLLGRSGLRAIRDGEQWMAGVAAGLFAHLVSTLFLFPTFELDVVAWMLAGTMVAASPVRPPRRLEVSVRATIALALTTILVVGVSAADVLADRRAADSVAAARRGDPA